MLRFLPGESVLGGWSNGVDLSPAHIFGSIVDAEAIHAHIPSTIEPISPLWLRAPIWRCDTPESRQIGGSGGSANGAMLGIRARPAGLWERNARDHCLFAAVTLQVPLLASPIRERWV